MLPSELLEKGWVNHCPQNTEETCLVLAFDRLKLLDHNAKVVLRALTDDAIAHWNDTHTKEEVIAVARLAEMKLGLRDIETEGEGKVSAVVAHALVN